MLVFELISNGDAVLMVFSHHSSCSLIGVPPPGLDWGLKSNAEKNSASLVREM
jgi:hypothetical protein